MAGIQVDLSGWREAAMLIRNLQPHITKYQLEEPLSHIQEIAVKVSKNTFRNKSDPDGKSWAPISPVTYRLGKPKGSAPLIRTGAMRREIHGTIIRRSRGPELIVQTRVPYADKHQLGDRRNRLRGHPAPIPQRQFIGLGDKHVRLIEKKTARWMDRYVDRPARMTKSTSRPKRLL